ncbi:MAG: tetratricopeptide repeat protein [Cyanobacteria bacterium P01_G01_bin.54]
MAKVALLIGVSEYESELSPLPAAKRDVAAMQRVLKDPEMGGFDLVEPLIDPESSVMQLKIETFFTEQRQRDDLVLLYFSGHGINDDWGNLYFGARNTRKNAKGGLIRSTAVAAQFVHGILPSRIKRQIIVLDCCFSGAFDPALRRKDDGAADVSGQLGAEGRVVLASSSHLQYSLEQTDSELSLYTRYLVEGIETGAGDLNEDGHIEVQELHNYAAERVQSTAPSMTPKLITLKDLGFKIILAKAKVTDPQLRYRKAVGKYAEGGAIQPVGQAVLDALRLQLNLTVAETKVIEAEVFQPYRERLASLEKYRQAVQAEAKHQFPFNKDTKNGLQDLQKILGLCQEDVTKIEQEFNIESVIEYTEESDLTTSRNSKSFSQSAEDFASQGDKKYEEGDYEGAIAEYNNALHLNPEFTQVYNNRGIAKSCLGDHKGAIDDYSQALRLDPSSANIYNNRGYLKYELGDKLGAINDYDKAILLSRDFAEAYNHRGLAKYELGDKKAAISDFNEALRSNPNFAYSYNNRGIVKLDLGDESGSVADHSQAIRLNPNSASAYNNRGNAKLVLGDKRGALTDYDQAIRLNSGYANAYFNRGCIKSDLDDKWGAIADYDQALRLNPELAEAYNNRGFEKSALGNREGAIRDYHNAAQIHQERGDFEGYKKALRQINKIENRGKGFWRRLFS